MNTGILIIACIVICMVAIPALSQVFGAPDRDLEESWWHATIVFTGIVLGYEDKGDSRYYEFQVLDVEKSTGSIPKIITVKSVTPEAYEPHDEDPVWGNKHVARLFFFDPETEREHWRVSYISEMITRHCNNSEHVVVKMARIDSPLICVTPDTAQRLSERDILIDRFQPVEPLLEIPKPEPKFLSKTVTEWKSVQREQLMEYHRSYSDSSFFSELGRFLIKDAMMQEMKKHGIHNKYDDFTVFGELSLTSLPPHTGFSAVVNATDQKTYLLGGSVFGNTIEGVYLRELAFYKNVLNSEGSQDEDLPYSKLLGTDPHVSISHDANYIRTDPHVTIFDLEQRNAVAFHNNLEYPIRIEAYNPDNADDVILKSATISSNQTGTMTFEAIGMYEYAVLRHPDNGSGLWEKKGRGEIIAVSEETETLPLEERLEIARSFLQQAREEIPFYSIGIGNGELGVGIKHSVEKSIPDYQEYYEKRIQQWIPFEVSIDVE